MEAGGHEPAGYRRPIESQRRAFAHGIQKIAGHEVCHLLQGEPTGGMVGQRSAPYPEKSGLHRRTHSGQGDYAQLQGEKARHKAGNEWAIVSDAHEAIVERRDFDSVQKALSLDTRRSPGDSAVQLFSGMVFCGECGASMVRKTVPSGNKKYVYYVCAAHKQDKSCSPHRMRDEALEQLVLDTVKQYIRDVVDLDDILAMTDTAPLRTAEAQKVQRQLDKKRSEHERLQKLLMSLYESLADGIIDRDEYARLKQNYAGRCAECEKQMDALQETLTQIKEHGGEHREWMAQFRKHLNIAELERSIVVALIDRILIYRDNRVEVRFRFADEFAWQTDILRRSQIREVV